MQLKGTILGQAPRGEACLETQRVLEINAGKAVFLIDRYKYSNPAFFQRATWGPYSCSPASLPERPGNCSHVVMLVTLTP